MKRIALLAASTLIATGCTHYPANYVTYVPPTNYETAVVMPQPVKQVHVQSHVYTPTVSSDYRNERVCVNQKAQNDQGVTVTRCYNQGAYAAPVSITSQPVVVQPQPVVLPSQPVQYQVVHPGYPVVPVQPPHAIVLK